MVSSPASRVRVWVIAAGLIAAIAATYQNSFDGPFVFDDTPAIVDNPTIRQLSPLSEVLLPPRGEGLTVEGRPVLNLTLALNHALGGTAVRGYHGFNLLVHMAAALTLFGVVRRTLSLPRVAPRFGQVATGLAAFITLLWSLHPLQTESVTYVIQRAEALVGLLYLLTLYGFIRAVACRPLDDKPAAANGTMWTGISVAACIVGMATKEVMVSAPLLVLLFDRAFVAPSWRELWRERRVRHLAVFSTWILLALLVVRAGTRGGTAGFGINVTPWDYALTQFEAVTRYVALSFWPYPLIFDYGVAWVERITDTLPYIAFVGVAASATIIAWRRRPMAGWLGILFFAVLSPTSSVVPGNRQTLAEHRMYLPLAAVVAGTVCGVYGLATSRRQSWRLVVAGLATALAFGLLTHRRNEDYRSEVVLYRDTAHKRPGNGFAHYNLAKAYAESGAHAAAVPEYEAALRLMAGAPGIHYNLANSLSALGRREEAIGHYESALRAEPRYGRAHFNLANLLVELGRKEEAAGHFSKAVEAEPSFIEARANLGAVLLDLGRGVEARTQLEEVLRTEPRHALALFNLGNVCLIERRWPEAIRHFEGVIALRPDLGVARERLELARSRAGR